MLRLIFVVLIIAAGSVISLKGPFHGLLFYLWNAYFRPESWVYGQSILALNLSFIVGTYVLVRTFLATPNPKISWRTGLIWMFFAQAVIGTYSSEHSDFSWQFLRDFSKVLIITYLIVVLINDRKQFRLVLLVMALSLGFETAKQGWANLFRAPGARNDNPIIFLGDNNGVAVGTMMLLPILGALAQTSSAWWQKHLHRFLAIGVFMRGITTYSRGGFLGAASLAVIAALRSERKLRAFVVIFAMGGLLWMVMPSQYFARMNTITVESEEDRDSSAAGRLHFWRVAVDMAQAKPLTGVGLNAFNFSYPSYNTDDRFSGERAAHSVWFGLLGDLGYPGLILFVGNVAMSFFSCWQVLRIARRNEAMRELRFYANALISALAVYCVGGTFLSYQYNEMVWHFFGLSSALYFIARSEASRMGATTVEVRAA
jgi:probable O-glycosylation ligase (exosortase A-associated)